MKKLIIYFAIIGLIVSVFVVKANTNIFKLFKQNNEPVQNTNMIKARGFNHNKKLLKGHDDIDDDGYANYISVSDVFISGVGKALNGGVINIGDINPTNIVSVYGAPNSQTTEFSEMYNDNVIVYAYPAADISFLNDKLLSVDIKDEGFSLIIKNADGSETWLTSGTGTSDLFNTFVSSWQNSTFKNIHVYLKTSAGVKTDASLTFGLVYDVNDRLGSPENNTIETITLQN